MKTANNSTATKNFDLLISKLSENEILDLQSMINVKGGEGHGTEPIIIDPRDGG